MFLDFIEDHVNDNKSSGPSNSSTKHKRQMHTHTHTHPFNDLLSRTTRVSRYQKGKTNLDFTEARDSEWHWHQLGHMQVCISLQRDNHASTPPSFLQARCSSCRPTNSVKAWKARKHKIRFRQFCKQLSRCGYAKSTNRDLVKRSMGDDMIG